MEEIDIALASDADYFPGLLVTSVSLARSASRDVSLRFNLLDGGVGRENLAFLEKQLAAAHPRVRLRTFPVDEARFEAFPGWTGGSRMAYARLLVAEVLSDLDFVLYCDVDFLWTADVAELWSLRDGARVLGACADGWCLTLDREADWFARHGLAFDPATYFCTGLLLINLRLWRAGDHGRRALEFLSAHPDVQFVDQTALNAVLGAGEVALLPEKWGRFSREIEARELDRAWAVHYAGCAPWHSNWLACPITPADRRWYALYGELTGLSAAEARRRFIPGREYLRRSLVYRLVRLPVARALLFLLLRLAGRGCYVPILAGKRLEVRRA